MAERVASLQSATYKKSGRPTRATRESHVGMWVVESSVLPSATRQAMGTAPSADTVKIHSNCLRSARWSLLCPKVMAAVGLPPRWAATAPW